jgi:hypothetical protein
MSLSGASFTIMDAKIDIKKLMGALRVLGGNKLPMVMAHTLNSTTKSIELDARKNAKSRMTIRRSRSLNGIKQDRQARGNNSDKMFSRVSIYPSWMVGQEIGGNDKGHPDFSGKVPIATEYSRGGSIKNIIKKMFYLNQPDVKESVDIGENYEGKGFKRFFLGTPKGKNRKYGIWFRHSNNKILTMVRRVVQPKILKGKDFFQDAIKKFGTNEVLVKKFSRAAQKAIRDSGFKGS